MTFVICILFCNRYGGGLPFSPRLVDVEGLIIGSVHDFDSFEQGYESVDQSLSKSLPIMGRIEMPQILGFSARTGNLPHSYSAYSNLLLPHKSSPCFECT